MKTLIKLMTRLRWSVIVLTGICVMAPVAHAVPSFARQTGLECTVCHVSWPELTSVGRQFKLGGYTLMRPATKGERPLVSFDRDDDPPLIPIAGFLQTSITRTANVVSPGTSSSDFPDQYSPELQQVSLFLSGRWADHLGSFIQLTYEGQSDHGHIDNADVRYANTYHGDGLDVAYGFSLNNNPTISDIYNSTPVWGFPYASSGVAPTPAASTLIESGLGQQVVGLTAYSMWNRTLYAEVGGYQTADGWANIFREGIDRSQAAVLDGTAPYFRLALQHDWDNGTHAAMVGAFGLSASKYPDPLNPVGQTDKFNDMGIDAQYQYVTDRHRITGQLSYIRESQNLDGSFAAGGSDSVGNTLTSLNAKLTYYFQTKYGVTLGYQRVGGDVNNLLYATGNALTGSASGSPDSEAYILELNWLPWRDRRFTAQYTSYSKFNGASTNYDGFGRNASDNNTLYLLAWFMF